MALAALLRKTKHSGPPTVADLEAALTDLGSESAQAANALERMKAGRKEILLTKEDEEARKHDESIADFERRLIRANERIEALKEEIEERKVEEADRAKREERSAIEKKVETARKVLLTGYEKAAREIVRIIGEIAAADQDVERFAKRYPDEQPIAGVEQIRARPAEPEKIVRSERVDLWCYAESGEVVPQERLQNLRTESGSKGVVYSPSGNPSDVTKTRFERVEIIPPVAARRADALARTINLPELRAGDPAFWSHVDSHYASAVLTQLERRAPARAAVPAPEVVLRPIKGDPAK